MDGRALRAIESGAQLLRALFAATLPNLNRREDALAEIARAEQLSLKNEVFRKWTEAYRKMGGGDRD
jgi:hypothetical protein